MPEQEPQEGVVTAHSSAEGVRIVRNFAAPIETVFACWTEPEHFATWFGEDGSSVPVDSVSMDLRPGGAWTATMLVGPDQMELVFSGSYVEIDPPRRLVQTLAAPNDPDNPDVEIMSAELAELGDGMTQMTFSQTGGQLPADEYSRALRGELVFFDRLAEHLQELKARHDTDPL